MPLTVNDYEAAFLRQMLGGSALASDTLNDLRYKFYKGVIDGTIVIGGGGGGGGAFSSVPLVGGYMSPNNALAGAVSAGPFAAGSAQPLVYFDIPKTISIDQMGFRAQTAQAVGAKVLLYASDTNNLPNGNLIQDSGNIDCTPGGDLFGTFAPKQLTAGRYWATIISNAGTTLRFIACSQSADPGISAGGITNLWNIMNYQTGNPGGTYAAPAAALTSRGDNTTTGSSNIQPMIFLRRSA